jgi:hypothetical protein
MKMNDADLISTVRAMRRLTITLDSIGYPARQLEEDEEIATHLPKGINAKITGVAADVHNMIQKIENTKRYKDALRQLCGLKEIGNGREH